MSHNDTFPREGFYSPPISEGGKESPEKPLTYRQRLKGTNKKDFQETVLSVLTDIQSKQDHQLKTITSELNDIKSQNAKIQKTQNDLEEAIHFVSAQYEDMSTKIGNLEEKMKDNTKLKATQSEHSGHIYELQTKLEDLNRRLREKSVEVKNIPFSKDEDKMEIVHSIYKSLSLDFDKAKVTDIHRVFTKDRENKPLIIEMNTIQSKTELLGGVKTYNKANSNNPLGTKNLGYSGNNVPIYAADYLTPLASRLYYLARDLKRQYNFKYCWTHLGKIYLKRSDDSPSILLKNEAQIEELKAKN